MNPRKKELSHLPRQRLSWDGVEVRMAVAQRFSRNKINMKLWPMDHNFDMAQNFAKPLLDDLRAKRIVSMAAFHDYRGRPEEMAVQGRPGSTRRLQESSSVGGAHRLRQDDPHHGGAAARGTAFRAHHRHLLRLPDVQPADPAWRPAHLPPIP
jgi:hypothetical protein